MASLPFSKEYGFASKYDYRSKNSAYSIEEIVLSKLKEEGIKNPDIYDSCNRGLGDFLYILCRIKSDSVEDCYYLLSLNVSNKNIDILEVFTLNDLIAKNLLENDKDVSSLDLEVIEKFSNKITFLLNPVYIDPIRLTYNPLNMETKFEDYQIDNSYDQYKFNNEYQISEIEAISRENIIVTSEERVWSTKESIKESDAYDQIKNIYPSVTDFEYRHFVAHEELFIYICFSNSMPLKFDSITTTTMIFKADPDTESVQYLGYVPQAQDLSAIFKL